LHFFRECRSGGVASVSAGGDCSRILTEVAIGSEERHLFLQESVLNTKLVKLR
jgi:hypothetical protein